jgi:hypothetical protein
VACDLAGSGEATRTSTRMPSFGIPTSVAALWSVGSGHIVQDCPVVVMCWVDIPGLSAGGGFRRRCPFGALPFVVLMTDGQPRVVAGCQA